MNFPFFEGRMRRRTFWINNLILDAILLVPTVLAYSQFSQLDFVPQMFVFGALIIGFLISLPWTVKRFHDLGNPGWWVGLLFVPVLSFFVGIKLLFVSGEYGPNQYGPDPKRPELTEADMEAEAA